MVGRGRRLDDLRNDAYKRADCEGATDRHPSADVTRYLNQGGTELYDILVEARGRAYFKKKPPLSITTLAGTTSYDLPPDFYRLVSVRRQGQGGDLLRSMQPQDEPWLREPANTTSFPTHYELEPANIELLPLHAPGTVIIVDYVPVYTDLVADADQVNGVNGWEEYMVCFAARCMAVKDEEWQLVGAVKSDMASLKMRIAGLAPKRDAFRAERVKNVRGFGGRTGGWRP